MPLFSRSFNWDNNCMLTALMGDNRRTIYNSPTCIAKPIGIYKRLSIIHSLPKISCCIVIERHLDFLWYFRSVIIGMVFQYKALYHDFIASFVATKIEDNLQV